MLFGVTDNALALGYHQLLLHCTTALLCPHFEFNNHAGTLQTSLNCKQHMCSMRLANTRWTQQDAHELYIGQKGKDCMHAK